MNNESESRCMTHIQTSQSESRCMTQILTGSISVAMCNITKEMYRYKIL